MYLRERLDNMQPGRFVEIGPGSGEITRLLLDYGWTGYCYDIEEETIDALKQRFASEVTGQRLFTKNQDFLAAPPLADVDLVISCMVMEHLDDSEQLAFLQKASECLGAKGVMFAFVPASPSHWGIEDDIAGHYRRYTRAGIRSLVETSGWTLRHIAGLTFPLSNLLLPLSNHLVHRSEKQKLSLSMQERTKQSGRRLVNFKTRFPTVLGLLLNRYTMIPLHILQKMFAGSESALVLFFEASPGSGAAD
jgi:cyclopropane fatty-acyl-phospholipid synthase-like methyltransferase